MSLEIDHDILQDFIVESEEILELLSKQLVELETKPGDSELLNAIFRGFHTIKGGAGFLSLNNLVNICHVSENVFDLLRQKKRTVDAQLMDVILKTLDVINLMFIEMKKDNTPSVVDPDLIVQLKNLMVENDIISVIPEQKIAKEQKSEPKEEFKLEPKKSKVTTSSSSNEITEKEFEELLNALHGPVEIKEQDAETQDSKKSDVITDDEFELLLDELDKKKERVQIHAEEQKKSPTLAEEAKLMQIKGAKEIGAFAETTVRVDTSRLDEIMNMVGELVLVRNRLVKLKNVNHDDNLAQAIGNLDIVTADLQMAVMKTRMQPIKKIFSRFPRVVRDLARNLKKEVVLEMEGEETDLDKNLVEALSDPLVHLVRNSVDHGIESPGERERNGKPRSGKIVLSAEQTGDHIILSIADDGQGMDPDTLRKSAIEKGLLDEDTAARLDDKECFNLIFAPGFSTKKEISNISGRGVGMDVVKTKINQLNGSIEIVSKKGEGSRITITVPLTLAILPTLMVVVGNQTYALPLTCVNEIFDLDLNKTNIVDGRLVVIVRDKALPLFYLKKWLNFDEKLCSKSKNIGHVVIVTVGNQRIGFVVDGLLGQEEVVIKTLGNMLHGTAGMAGATITGDGKIAMILDVPSLISRYA